MLKTYRSLLSIPHARAFVLAGFVARLSISMRALGAVLRVSQLTGFYGLAGAVAAAALLGEAFAAPRLGRLVDRYGQRRTLLVPRCALRRDARARDFGAVRGTKLGAVGDRGAIRGIGAASVVAGASPMVGPCGGLPSSGYGVRAGVNPRRTHLRAGTSTSHRLGPRCRPRRRVAQRPRTHDHRFARAGATTPHRANPS